MSSQYKLISLPTEIRDKIKQNLRSAIIDYVDHFTYENTQPLDLLIPNERKVRSVVGGLETSMGTRVWEPIARILAEYNDFKIIDNKILKPRPFPEELLSELSRLINLRESRGTWINSEECVARLRKICDKFNREDIEYISPPAGTGVDLKLEKDGVEYAFDIKTVQPNVGSIKSFNKQLLEWYAYSLFKRPGIKLICRIAYPYNPYTTNFWSHTPHNQGILQPQVDAVVENELWDFLSGLNYTYQQITAIFMELNDDGFGHELSEKIKLIQAKVSQQVC